MTTPRSLRRSVEYPHPPSVVWTALTDPQALAEWLMPNNFKAEVGHRFQFRVDPMMSMSGVVDCEVLDLEPQRRLTYSWLVHFKNRPPHVPMTVSWTLATTPDGCRLTLEQSGLEALSPWWRFSMRMGWGRMMKTLLPKVMRHVKPGGEFLPGAITRRDYGITTVPEEFAR